MINMKLLIILFFASQILYAKPPFHGTIFVDPDIITSDDPTAFKSLKQTSMKKRKMFDRRTGSFDVHKAHIFIAKFDDGKTIEVQVNPEFDSKSALKEAAKYLPAIGRLPRALREDVETVWIHSAPPPKFKPKKSIFKRELDALNRIELVFR